MPIAARETLQLVTARTLSFAIADRGSVSALLLRPAGARVLYVLGHGAGAGMRHRFMDSVATHLFHQDIATFRYQFPYMEAGRRGPDSPSVLGAAVRAAVAAAHDAAPDLPIVAGGKSLSGRISSQVVASDAPPVIKGLIFLGYPLHPPKKPSVKRSEHLSSIRVPMLFLQGTRDELADLDLFEPIMTQLGPIATLHTVQGGDHSFNVLRRSGRTEQEVMEELAGAISTWTRKTLS